MYVNDMWNVEVDTYIYIVYVFNNLYKPLGVEKNNVLMYSCSYRIVGLVRVLI